MAIGIALNFTSGSGSYSIAKSGDQGAVDVVNLSCVPEVMAASFDEMYLNVKVGQKNTQYPFTFEEGDLEYGHASVDISKSIPGFACSVVISLTLISEKYPSKMEVIETNSLEYILPDRFAETYARKDEVYDKEHTYSKNEVYSKNETYSKDEVYAKEEIDSMIGDVETLLSDV